MTETTPRLLPAVRVTQPAFSLSEVERLGVALAGSRFFSDAADANKAMAKILAGRELGLGPVASLTGIYFTRNKLSLSANAMASVIQGSGRWRFRVKELSDGNCVLLFQERDEESGRWEDLGPSAFSIEDARKAGLANNDTYKKFPRNMLFARALSNGAKWYCPAAFGGSAPYTPDELDPRARLQEDGEYVVPAAEEKSTKKAAADERAALPQISCGTPVTDAEVVEPTPPAAAVAADAAGDLQEVGRLMAETRTALASVKRRFHKAPEEMGPDELQQLLAALRQKAADLAVPA